MTRKLCLLLLLVCYQPQVLAVDGVTITGGDWRDHHDRRYGYRFAPRWNWSDVIYAGDYFAIKGFWETSIANWHASNTYPGENDSLWIAAASPMVQFRFSQWKTLVPFFELGIGASAMNKNTLGSQDLGSYMHFEDKIGFGLSSGTSNKFELGYRYMHYSNASLKKPNDGLDFHTINFSYFFS